MGPKQPEANEANGICTQESMSGSLITKQIVEKGGKHDLTRVKLALAGGNVLDHTEQQQDFVVSLRRGQKDSFR